MREPKVKRSKKNAQGHFRSFRHGFNGRAFQPVFSLLVLVARAWKKDQGEKERDRP